jgi:hypothetical protein
MSVHLAASAVNSCQQPGTWAQQWACGWNQPTTTAAHLGAVTGHSILPVLLVILAVAAVVLAARRSRRGAPARAGARR